MYKKCLVASQLSRSWQREIHVHVVLRFKIQLVVFIYISNYFGEILQFPEALRPAFPRLKEKLEDGEPGYKIQRYYDYNFNHDKC